MRRAGWLLTGLLLATPAAAQQDAPERQLGQWRVRGPVQGYCQAWAASTDGHQEVSFHIAVAAGGPRLIMARWTLSMQEFAGTGLQESLQLRAGGETATLRITYSRPDSFAAVFETPFDPGLLARRGAIELWARGDHPLIRLSSSGAAAASRAIAACLAGRPPPAR